MLINDSHSLCLTTIPLTNKIRGKSVSAVVNTWIFLHFPFSSFANPAVYQGGDGLHSFRRQRVSPPAPRSPARHQRHHAV